MIQNNSDPSTAKPARIKIVLSDVHMGAGKFLDDGSYNLMEDFTQDERLIELIDYYTFGPFQEHDVEIILNGDILNLISLDYKGYFPYIITERISMEKIKAVIKGHQKVWKALAQFLSKPHRQITYIIGNHDIEVLWKGCRDLLNQAVGGEINFRNLSYFFDGIWIEHGNQYELVNRIEPKKMFITHQFPQPILNLPWGSVFVICCINHLKKINPNIDKVKPLRLFVVWSFFFNIGFFFRLLALLLSYALIPWFYPQLFKFPNIRSNLKIFLQIFRQINFEHVAEKIVKHHKEINTVIFGHTHIYRFKNLGPQKAYFNSGTWTEVTSLHLGTLGKQSRLTYVLIDYPAEGQPARCQLLNWFGKAVPFTTISG